MKEKLKKVSENLLNVLFPNDLKCIFCGRDIPDFENVPFCQYCLKENFFLPEKHCRLCDAEIFDEKDICDFCAQRVKRFDRALCPLVYEGNVRSAIIAFKDNNAKYLTEPFVNLMLKRFREESSTAKINFDLVIPVPIHIKTKKKRGYNQSSLLAHKIAKSLNIPFREDLLIKFKLTKKQKTLNYSERQNNLRDSFTLTEKNFLKGKNVLIVDDIVTTGATTDTCAKLLKDYGVKTVYVLAIARNNFHGAKRIEALKIKYKL